MADPMLIAQNAQAQCHLLPGLANRHGLITGATGTGKTVTLQTLAESFSRMGVPVFMADVKGDLTGVSQAGKIGDKLAAVLKDRGLGLPEPLACPTTITTRENTQEMADDLFEAVTSGKVKIHIEQTFPLANIQGAHSALEARKTTGCTIITL